MGSIYARLIYKQSVLGIQTGYGSLKDVPDKHKSATRVAYKKIYGVDVPED
jgi:hypothetical protein